MVYAVGGTLGVDQIKNAQFFYFDLQFAGHSELYFLHRTALKKIAVDDPAAHDFCTSTVASFKNKYN
jgi:hypothetical protein